MIPHADDNFEDSAPLRRWTPTTIDLVSPFEEEEQDDLAIPRATQLSNEGSKAAGASATLDPQLAMDAPTAFLHRDRFQELPPGTIVGESYEIGQRLGAGSMGEVYAARHMGLGKHVAIKVIGQRLSEDDRAIERFITEARTLAQIQHPAIVTVEHVGELPDGRAYFVMEHLRGESLSERLSRGRLPFQEALRILDQMTRGLAAAHLSGVVHRDLKPDNTFLVHHTGEQPAVKLLDFGLAKLTATNTAIVQCENDDERPDGGLIFGTPLYMSPEQARGLHLDHRSDIYALGCVAYELVLDVRPFPQAQTTTAIYAAHLHETPPSPRSIWPAIPPQLDLVLFSMLAKDPADRPTLAQIRTIIKRLRRSAHPRRSVTAPVGISPLTQVVAAICILAAGALLGIAVSSTIHARSHSAQNVHSPAPPTAHPETSNSQQGSNEH